MATTVVTGAGGGIGSAVVRRFVDRGDDVLGLGRDEAALTTAGARPVPVDLADPGSVAAALEPVLPERVDVLVHCAGTIELAAVGQAAPEVWTRQLTVNLVAAAEVTRCVLPALRSAGGHIVFVNFFSGHGVTPGWGPYAASKFGLRALAEALRDEEDRFGVGVTSVYPACTATDMQRGIREGHGRRYRPEAYVQPETVAGLIFQAATAPRDCRVTDLTVQMASPRAGLR